MSVKTLIGKIWTDSVAYVALFAGAGLSIAGNVMDTSRVRGASMDALDVTMAVAFPALVVLMVEVFVSSRWVGLKWPMQILRWAGTLAIGAVAMRVSWVHLNELMLSRGQEKDVAVLGPLAIDFLAIMATALILAGRVQAKPLVSEPSALDILAKRQEDMDKLMASTRVVMPTTATQEDADTSEAIMSTPLAYMSQPTVADEAQSYLDRLATELDSGTTAAYPVSPAPMSNAVKADSVPEDARELIWAWHFAPRDTRPTPGQADALVAAAHGVTTRTARRWRDALKVSA